MTPKEIFELDYKKPREEAMRQRHQIANSLILLWRETFDGSSPSCSPNKKEDIMKENE